MTEAHEERLLLGSYAVGGLEADEARRVEEHLSACADCRRALDRIAPLPELLDLIDPQRASEPAPAPWLEDRVVAGFAATARRPPAWPRRRALALAGLAAAGAVAGVLALAGALHDDAQRDVMLAPQPGAGAVEGRARLVSTSHGTRVELDARLPPLRGSELYELWFVGRAGRISAGTFTVGAGGRARLRLASAARVADYDRIGITREPDGRDPARNGPSLLVGRLY